MSSCNCMKMNPLRTDCIVCMVRCPDRVAAFDVNEYIKQYKEKNHGSIN